MNKGQEGAREAEMAAPAPTRGSDAARLPEEYLQPISDVSRFEEPEAYRGSIGRTMFDLPTSHDGSVTILLPAEEIAKVPIQSLVRIHSVPDNRIYLGVVTSGPFAEPDGLRSDSNIIVTTAVRGGIFMPRFHGRVQVELIAEESDGEFVPPRFRPRPNSPVFVLGADDKARILRPGGDIRLGVVIGDEEVVVGAPADRKSVLPRHTAVLGTTGAGKSTTMGRFISQAQARGFTVVLLDTEGEYVRLHEPAVDAAMLVALRRRGIEPIGIPETRLYHLAGTETANNAHPRRFEFGLSFTSLSAYTVAEILDMTDAQQERFLRTIDVGKQVLRDLKIFPRNATEERQALEINDFEEGYPGLTLSRVIDLAGAMLAVADKVDPDSLEFFNAEFRTPQAKAQILRRVEVTKPSHAISWRATLSRLWRLNRLGIFDQRQHQPIVYDELLAPGRVSIVDLSGTESPAVNNIVIADILREIQRSQDAAYRAWEAGGNQGEPRKVLIVIEEAHEFLSASRISKMPVLFEQVARIAKRGRKRWLGLVFVTQLPQHLPREVLGLVNNYILHRINDEGVIRGLRQVIPGIDEAMWNRLPALAPGQAIVSMTHMARPLLVSVDPAPCRLRMID
jgi:DNA helicase HerA-like ATPase